MALWIFEQALIRNRQLVQAVEEDHRLPLLIFGRGLPPHFVRRKFHGDATATIADRTEVQQVPIDSELAAADAKEAAEVDNGSTWLCVLIDDHVDDSTIFSSALLRTSLPRIPWTSLLSSAIAEGGLARPTVDGASIRCSISCCPASPRGSAEDAGDTTTSITATTAI